MLCLTHFVFDPEGLTAMGMAFCRSSLFKKESSASLVHRIASQDKGISVCMIHPGFVATRMVQQHGFGESAPPSPPPRPVLGYCTASRCSKTCLAQTRPFFSQHTACKPHCCSSCDHVCSLLFLCAGGGIPTEDTVGCMLPASH